MTEDLRTDCCKMMQEWYKILDKYEFDFIKKMWSSGEGYSIFVEDIETPGRFISINFFLTGAVRFSSCDQEFIDSFDDD